MSTQCEIEDMDEHTHTHILRCFIVLLYTRYKMEMSSVKQKLDVRGKINEANKEKQVGNDYFKAGDVQHAIKKYHFSLLYLKDIEKPPQLYKLCGLETEKLNDKDLLEVSSLRCSCYNNLAGGSNNSIQQK